MTNTYINSDELLAVSTSIKSKANAILTSYQNDCQQAIVTGTSFLQVSGLDSTSITNSLNTIYTNLTARIDSLSTFLSTNVVQQYDLVTQSILNEFNDSVIGELASLLGITLGPTIVTSPSETSQSNTTVPVTGNGCNTILENQGNQNDSETIFEDTPKSITNKPLDTNIEDPASPGSTHAEPTIEKPLAPKSTSEYYRNREEGLTTPTAPIKQTEPAPQVPKSASEYYRSREEGLTTPTAPIKQTEPAPQVPKSASEYYKNREDR